MSGQALSVVALALTLVLGVSQVQHSSAQTVTFEPPREIVVTPGRLSVTFVRSVTRAEAERIVTDMGLTVVESRFDDVAVIANANSPFSDDDLASLRAHPRVIEVEAFAVAIDPEHHVSVTFQGTVDPEEAEWIVSEWRPVGIVSVRFTPHEVVIDVTPGKEEAATAALKANEKVVDVLYVADTAPSDIGQQER